MGNNQGKVPIKDLPCKTMENRKQCIWVGKAMPDPAVDPDITINLRNRVTKSENQKPMRYLNDAISTKEQHPMPY